MGNYSLEQAQQKLNSTFNRIASNTDSMYANLISSACASYEKKHRAAMSPAKKAILQQNLQHLTSSFVSRDKMSRQQIASAVEDVTKVDNPITMLYNLVSLLIPNFAYTEVVGVQPLPTKSAPIYFPNIVAAETRNNVTQGDVLLGSTNWNASNSYSTNKKIAAATVSVGSANVSFTAAEANIIPGTVCVTITLSGVGTTNLFDDGKGNLTTVTGFTSSTAGTVNYGTGAVAFALAANAATGDKVSISYRYELGASTQPAQAILEWSTKTIEANPYRLRSVYSLDNYYSAKQVLSGFDVDQVMSTALAGYINKEISGNVFDDMLNKVDATYSWSHTLPTGVAWALHRLEALQTFIAASNGIRQNVTRSGGNYVICGTDWMNLIETFGNDVWAPTKYEAEPIGPYVAGTLLGKFKVIKNQDYPSTKAVMGFKRDETDASYMAGVYIGLYATNPIAKDDLSVVQGMGTQMGSVKVFDNSLVQLTYN